MKHIYALISIATVIALAGCRKEQKPLPKPQIPDTFAVSISSLQTKYRKSDFKFDITCYTDWEIFCANNWISVNQDCGNAPCTVSVTVDENMEGNDRTGILEIQNGNKKHTITISQTSKPVLKVEDTTISIDGDGGIKTVLFMCSIEEVEIIANETWIRIIEDNSNIRKVAFDVSRNMQTEPRSGSLSFKLKDYPEISCSIAVHQGPKIDHPKLTLSEGQSISIASLAPYTFQPVFEDMPPHQLDWSVSNPQIAKVDNYGTITILSSGSCIITAHSILYDLSASIRLEVKLKAEGMDIYFGEQHMNGSPIALRYVGEHIEVAATINPPEAYSDDITIYSSDEKIAKVVNKSIVCLSPGSTDIYIESIYQNLKYRYTLIVIEP